MKTSMWLIAVSAYKYCDGSLNSQKLRAATIILIIFLSLDIFESIFKNWTKVK